MKKAIITTGGKQYMVAEGETIEVELLNLKDSKAKTISFEPLLVIDGEKTSVGTPNVTGAKVTAEIVDADVAGPKVVGVRYKPKKRVHKVHGHRQHHANLKITKIA